MKSEIALDTPVPRSLVALLPATPKGAALCRRTACRQLADWGLDSVASEPFHSARLVVAELAANAITHGRVPGRMFELGLALTPTAAGGALLRIEVSDCRGDRYPAPGALPTADSQSGRGLMLIDALADRWGAVPRPPGGKTVWAEIELPAVTSVAHVA
ncbi:ATP-binding protein [Kitasatospora sp. A2-31]|uniref:ATP-binding protein n=1 Tax=Kitasatospora sp. A2-31 TaxID=2916414 RepID=UPI001EEA1B1C|nr:ATP-binding protein [Kitasatospora sp. A2-31]MCG6495813.1 ATP-binding protein [Kitasatospora sp. A2-31]